MAWTNFVDLEEGDLSDFDSTSGTGLSADAAAAYNGSYGFKVAITDTTARYGILSTAISNEKDITAAFLLHPNGLIMAEGDTFPALVLKGSGPISFHCVVRLGFSGGTYSLDAYVYDDSSVLFESLPIPIGDDWHKVVVHWGAAPSAGLSEGWLLLWIDGVCRAAFSGLDNDQYDVDQLRFGAVMGLDSGTSGDLYMDDMAWQPGTRLIPGHAGARLVTRRPQVVRAQRYRALNAPRRDLQLNAKRRGCV